MNYLKYFIISICSVVAPAFSHAQTSVTDTISYGIFKGVEKYNVIYRDDTRLKNGRYAFSSDLITSLKDDAFLFKQYKVDGSYNRDQKNNIWNYKTSSFRLEDLSVRGTTNAILQHTLNGVEDDYAIKYSSGSFHGSATYTQRTIAKGRYQNPIALAAVTYDMDTIKGEFNFTHNDVVIKGKTDKNGYLDGILRLQYIDEGDSILEKRTYQNGFLLALEKLNRDTDKQLEMITYDEVSNMLASIKLKAPDLDYVVSDAYFGLKFNIGYPQTDKRVVAQLKGNEIIQRHIHLFDTIHNHHSLAHSKESVLKLTNRFKYLYDASEDSIVNLLSKQNAGVNERIEATLNKPNVILRKNQSAPLLEQYHLLAYLKEKSDILQTVYDKILTGYFHHRARHKYYTNGIPGLNKPDTLSYVFRTDTLTLPLIFEQYITNSNNLIVQLGKYTNDIEKMADASIAQLSQALTVYENQEKIDSLDRVISLLDVSLNNKYAQTSGLDGGELSKEAFSQKVYDVFNERFLIGLKTKYLNNSLPQDEMLSLGQSIICYHTFLDNSHAYLDSVGNMQDYWNDSLFTQYKDNPFDFRKFETKILEGVQNAANILLQHYASQLLNAKGCEQVQLELGKINLLNKRVQFLVKNNHLEKVQQLNKVLRRERVTNRIERLLEL